MNVLPRCLLDGLHSTQNINPPVADLSHPDFHHQEGMACRNEALLKMLAAGGTLMNGPGDLDSWDHEAFIKQMNPSVYIATLTEVRKEAQGRRTPNIWTFVQGPLYVAAHEPGRPPQTQDPTFATENARGRNPPSCLATADFESIHLGLVSKNLTAVYMNCYTMVSHKQYLRGEGLLVLRAHSCIIGPDGRRLTPPLADSNSLTKGLVYADLDLTMIVTNRHFIDVVGYYSRPDLLWVGVDKKRKDHVRKKVNIK
ncbi:hypothetical protein CHU98_g1858 [Xylaria longipes]|nr:hypothetical protein CHU98_g1858 [Xylaria longipes]